MSPGAVGRSVAVMADRSGPVVVGVVRSERSADALALAQPLAAALGSELLLVCAYPYEPVPGHDRPEYERAVRAEASAALEEAGEALAGIRVRTEAVPSFSPARVLIEAAERERAAAIVIASTHRGSAGRVATATVADRLLSGSPCPVAIAPREYAEHAPPRPFARVGAAFAPTQAGQATVAVAGDLARRCDGVVEVVAVSEPDRVPSEAAAQEAAAALDGVPADVRMLEGDPVQRLREASAGLDLLVCGSRDYGPASIVLAGGVSKALARDAACPVLVIASRHAASGDAP